jgi:CYTH domain-containing protein/CHAD domain-containing protein
VSSEIERKFLISTAPDWLGECSPLRIEQGYLAIAEETEVRLRRAKGELTLTAKRGHGVVREEIEIALGPGQFAELWPLSTQWRVTKTRHIVPLGDGLRAEVDVYAGPLEGLATAEVEFESEARSRWFRPPDWLDRELTGDARYSNQSLATNGRPMHNSAKDGKERSMTSEGKGKTYRLQRNESSADGLRRVVRGRVTTASKRLRDAANGDLADSIHGARKDLKKIRAVLRLVRAELGDKRFRAEDRRYRDAGRRLSGSRDAKVKLETLRALEVHFGDDCPAGPSLAWSEELETDLERVAGSVRGEATAETELAIEEIDKAGERIAGWPLEADSWQLIEPGLNRTYRSGREALKEARVDGSSENVHELRKRAKDLWYQLRLLCDAWPSLMEETAEQVHELAELLGDHHDLAVLAEDLEGRAEIVAERETFAALIEQRQAELLDRALGLGGRVYAEKPKHFRHRLRAYWQIWRES